MKMIADFKRRGYHKSQFIKEHKNFVSQAFKEAEVLMSENKDVRDSKNVCDLINLARIELKYSIKTYALDIFFSLKKIYKKEERDG